MKFTKKQKEKLIHLLVYMDLVIASKNGYMTDKSFETLLTISKKYKDFAKMQDRKKCVCEFIEMIEKM